MSEASERGRETAEEIVYIKVRSTFHSYLVP